MRHAILQLVAAVAMVVAIAMRRAERRLLRSLRAADATSAERAIALGRLRPVAAFRLRRLTRGGAVRPDATGRFYLDESGYGAYRRARRQRAAVLVAIVAAVAAGVFVWQAVRAQP